MAVPRVELLRPEDLPVDFGRYRLVSVLGEGGMARVFGAELVGPSGFRKRAAVKVIGLAGLGADRDKMVRALVREARLGGLLHHPNVVETYEYGEADGQPFIAMELVTGIGLDGALRWGPRPAPKLALEIGAQICAGLAHAHDLAEDGRSAGLVHRDLKPSNVLVTLGGGVKVADFGIAKAQHLGGNTTRTGLTKGTPAYMSPEQANGQALDSRSDLFAVGALVWELLVGRRLFDADHLMATMLRVVRVEDLLNQGVLSEADERAPGVGELLRGCLRFDPEQRWSSATEVEEALRAVQATLVGPTDLRAWVGACRAASDRAALAEAAVERPRTLELDDDSGEGRVPPTQRRLETPAPPRPPPVDVSMDPASVGPRSVRSPPKTTAPRPGRALARFLPLALGGFVASTVLAVAWWNRPAPRPQVAQVAEAVDHRGPFLDLAPVADAPIMPSPPPSEPNASDGPQAGGTAQSLPAPPEEADALADAAGEEGPRGGRVPVDEAPAKGGEMEAAVEEGPSSPAAGPKSSMGSADGGAEGVPAARAGKLRLPTGTVIRRAPGAPVHHDPPADVVPGSPVELGFRSTEWPEGCTPTIMMAPGEGGAWIARSLKGQDEYRSRAIAVPYDPLFRSGIRYYLCCIEKRGGDCDPLWHSAESPQAVPARIR